MSQYSYQFDDLLALRQIIRDASDSSLKIYFAQSTADYKSDGSIVTEADLAMQQTLTTSLQQRFPGVHMLSEENSTDEQSKVMLSGEDYWCLDPVDGTTNFHATMPLFSVSLGLVSHGELVLGAVYDPNRDEFFAAIRGQGFWINGERAARPTQPQTLGESIAFIDFKRLDAATSVSLATDTPYKSQRNIGTCALEWAWLAAGRANLLLHGRESLWDYSAGVLLNAEAGGCSETFDGEPIFSQTLDPRSVIAASSPQLFDQWSKRVRASSQAPRASA